nr:coiled-coil domain-containing protein 162-like [Chlorocebus sabaeus]
MSLGQRDVEGDEKSQLRSLSCVHQRLNKAQVLLVGHPLHYGTLPLAMLLPQCHGSQLPLEADGCSLQAGLEMAGNNRRFQPRPRCLLSADGKVFLNLWFIPHSSEVLIMFKTLPEKAAFKALKRTLQLIAPLHDIVAYLVSFAKLGNCAACFEFPLSPNPLRGDWGGTEGIGSELQELQNMTDSLQSPQDPTRVAQALLLRREVMFLQFDAAVRHLIRRTFLAAGNVPAYQSVTDGMCHGLPALSNCLRKSIFASQLSLPQPLDPRSLQAFELFPWRAFLEDGGLFPAMSSSPDALEYNMQVG